MVPIPEGVAWNQHLPVVARYEAGRVPRFLAPKPELLERPAKGCFRAVHKAPPVAGEAIHGLRGRVQVGRTVLGQPRHVQG